MLSSRPMFSTVFRREEIHPATSAAKHHIVTSGKPLSFRAQNSTPDALAIAKAALVHMLDLGIVRSSSRPWV